MQPIRMVMLENTINNINYQRNNFRVTYKPTRKRKENLIQKAGYGRENIFL